MQSVLFIGPRPGIPSARSIHSAEFRRITYRGIVRSTAGAHYGLTRSAAHERTSPAPSRHLKGNSSGATAPINNAPRPRPAPSFLAPSFPPRSVCDCFVSRVPSPGPPRVLSLRSSQGSFHPPPSRRGGPARPRRAAALAARRAPQRANPNAGSAGAALRLRGDRLNARRCFIISYVSCLAAPAPFGLSLLPFIAWHASFAMK